MSINMGNLAKRLVSDRLLQQSQAILATNAATDLRIPFVTHVIRSKLIDSRTVAVVAAEEFAAPVLDLDTFDLHCCPAKLVALKLIKRHQVLPLYHRGNCLYLAVSDPSNMVAMSEIKFHTGLKIDFVVVEEDKLHAAIRTFIERAEIQQPKTEAQENILGNVELLSSTGLDKSDLGPSENTRAATEPRPANEDPVVQFINKLLAEAVTAGASDLHFEPYEKSYRIRFRVDGILRVVAHPPVNLSARLASRLKVMSQMDIAERRIPQDGRIKMTLEENRCIEFRVNTLPTLWGEKIVLRVLDPVNALMGIDALGFDALQKQHYLAALNRQQGLILVTGPTGSGKTISLYSGLNIINTTQRNISTVEDPVEINLQGVNQVSVNPKIGLDFASTLRAFLRQDPDVVMVGEIRDLETAEIAIRAAQTGHLVLSTLHTNNAAATLTRLRGMGIPAFNLANSIRLIIAQRLARKLCKHCKETDKIPEKVLREEGFSQQQVLKLQIYRAVGCKHCKDGYRGRFGFYEVVPITEALIQIIMHDGDSIQIGEQARKEGCSTLRESVLRKVAQGVTSLEEANRLT